MPRIVLVQPGARHNYALPRFLHRHDMLQRFYTDFALGENALTDWLMRAPLPASLSAKLERRTTDAVPSALIRSGIETDLGRFGKHDLRGYRADDIAQADAFYVHYFAGGRALHRLAPNTPLISDVFIVPNAHHIVNAEIAAFSDWGETPADPALCQHYDDHSIAMFEQSDVLFCPSQAVIDAVGTFDARYTAKCRLIPYGASLRSAQTHAPEPGRVLFCGSLQLRKGVHHIRAAAAMLQETHPHIRFVFAGAATPTMRAKLNAPNIELLGHLGREALVREFGRADLFLFPSLAEGAAGTVLEAMASGLPIVATRAAGVDFTDGTSGIVVPPRDPEAIAAAVLRICDDRTLRATLAAGAAREAERYSMVAWETRFIAAVRDAV